MKILQLLIGLALIGVSAMFWHAILSTPGDPNGVQPRWWQIAVLVTLLIAFPILGVALVLA